MSGLHPYWLPLQEALKQTADPVVAAGASAYMKHNCPFFGVKAPVRRVLLKNFLAANGLPPSDQLTEIVKSAWEQPQRELHYCAMETHGKMHKKTGEEIISLYGWMICNKSWWDTVDYIAPHLVGEYFKRFPQQRNTIVDTWMSSGNFWLQRSCLLFQLKYGSDTDSKLLFSLVEKLAGEKEFFIRKAIGWALREYAKNNPEAVRSFVEKTELSGLSRREALKHLA
jgi:3-methyladenine DNA glycosylase AlkD